MNCQDHHSRLARLRHLPEQGAGWRSAGCYRPKHLVYAARLQAGGTEGQVLAALHQALLFSLKTGHCASAYSNALTIRRSASMWCIEPSSETLVFLEGRRR